MRVELTPVRVELMAFRVDSCHPVLSPVFATQRGLFACGAPRTGPHPVGPGLRPPDPGPGRPPGPRPPVLPTPIP